MKNFDLNACGVQEMNAAEVAEVNGGFVLLGSSGGWWSGKWFWRGVGIGATAGGIGAGAALMA